MRILIPPERNATAILSDGRCQFDRGFQLPEFSQGKREDFKRQIQVLRIGVLGTLLQCLCSTTRAHLPIVLAQREMEKRRSPLV